MSVALGVDLRNQGLLLVFAVGATKATARAVRGRGVR